MQKKLIAVNTRFLLQGKLEGIGRFTAETLQRITQQNPNYKFLFLFDRPFSPEFIFNHNIQPIVLPPPARHPILWYTWFEYTIPYILHKHKPQLFLSTDGFASLKTNTPTIPVIHDLAFEHFPKQVTKSARIYYKYFMPKYAQKATRIATVSEYTKSDIVQTYNINPDKIDVVYNGANDIYKPLSTPEIKQTQLQYSQNQPYFLFVGAIHPRKNLINTLKAFENFKTQHPNPTKLLIAGRKAWQTDETFHFFNQMNYKNDIIFLGHLQIQQLALIMGSALCLLYPSWFEGFGIPIVEAMYAQIPIITSNSSSMPEVAANAAILIQPQIPQTITDAMIQIYTNPQTVKQLIQNAQIQRQKFTWQQTADKLWNSIQKAI